MINIRDLQTTNYLPIVIGLFLKELVLYYTIPILMPTPSRKKALKTFGKKRKCFNKHFLLNNRLPHKLFLGSCNSAANKDRASKILTNSNTIFRLSRKYCGKRRNCSLRAISSFPTMFSKAVCY